MATKLSVIIVPANLSRLATDVANSIIKLHIRRYSLTQQRAIITNYIECTETGSINKTMSKQKRRILVTSALPYANGAIHLGHMLEYIQTDIWARFQRAQGHECYFAWADDAHGTPIMLRAQAENITPEELIDRMNAEHQTGLQGFWPEF